MKYKCLILDHDDTAVDSTASIHYPAHIEVMKRLRPNDSIVSLDEWFLKNFNPGILEYMRDELHFNPSEMELEYKMWQEYTVGREAEFYPGFLDIIREFKKRGGRVAIVSHSTISFIERDYRRANASDIPEMIYGWHRDSEKRKPSAYPVNQILEKLGIKPKEALILDDLKPALIMGRNTGVDVAAAGWGHQIPEIVDYMSSRCNYYFKTLDEFKSIILS